MSEDLLCSCGLEWRMTAASDRKNGPDADEDIRAGYTGGKTGIRKSAFPASLIFYAVAPEKAGRWRAVIGNASNR